jgi:hypothetical protein
MRFILAFAIALLAGRLQGAPPDFDTQVVPVFTRAGCNAGSCHGAAIGRGGFKLSLWGSDPDSDFVAIVKELEGRRINLARPEESLILCKAQGQLAHGGGARLDPDEAGWKRVLSWVQAGARREQTRQLIDFEVSPSEKVLSRPGESVTLHALARFSDDSREDVSSWCVVTAEDPAAVDVDAAGRITVKRRGLSVVLVRFLDRVEAVRLIVPLGESAVDLGKEARHNFIDDEVLGVLGTLRLQPSPQADDATFLRRVALDLTGTLPSPEEVERFLADRRADKRSRLIKELLDSDAFVTYWTWKWANLFQINSRALGQEGAQTFHLWVGEQLEKKTPWDEMARQMVTSLGDTQSVGPANFTRIPANAREHAEYVSRVFLGVRLQCANCHNHPLDRWTQDDYHGLAAVFAKLERGPVVKLVPRGEVIHPRTESPATPRIPGVRFLDANHDGRPQFVEWLTASDNPLFARAVVNRLWKEMMGRGLVEPADDLRATNPATHPRLLDQLTKDFVEHHHDIRHTLELIASSAAYQRSSQTTPENAADGRFYSHALIRDLPAEVLADALCDVTGVPSQYGDLPLGTRALTLYDSLIPSPALDILGRCSRLGPCEETAPNAGLARMLHLINGALINQKITDPKGRLGQLLMTEQAQQDLFEDFYLLALSRPPRAEERAYFQKKLSEVNEPEARKRMYEDFLWSLLTCREFVTNH